MQIEVVLLGKLKDSHYAELVSYYEQLTNRGQERVKLTVLPDKYSGAKVNPEELLENYNWQVNATFFLAEWGGQLTTEKLTNLLSQAELHAEPIRFVIGNAWGWEATHEAHSRLKFASLSQLTFNHELAAVMLWEQLYRYADKQRGGKYVK